MIKRLVIFGLPMALAIFLGACGPRMNPGTGGGSSPTPSVTAIHVASSGALGTYLTTATGLTLYYFTPDTATKVACTGGCVSNWPPLLATSGSPTSSPALPGKLTVLDGANGNQVLYNGHPLYTYIKDGDAGDAYGQGIGGKWYVATPDLAATAAYKY